MKQEFMKSKVEPVIGWLLLAVLLFASTQMTVGSRLLVGLGFGYVLMRAYTGFAGSVNRAFRGGSTKLMRSMALMFFVSAVLFVALMYFNGDPESYKLSVKAINLGLVLGALLFGFGMALCSCCASGALTDLANGTPRAIITLIFFFPGVYLGFRLQHTQGWIKDTLFSSSSYQGKGVFLPDLFPGDPLNGYIGGLVLTGIFSLALVGYAFWYEKMKRAKNEFSGIGMETVQETPFELDTKNGKFFSKDTYYYIFARPWTLNQGAIGLAVMATVVLGVTKKSWGVTTAFGIWFGNFLQLFGVSSETLAEFAQMKPDDYAKPFLEYGGGIQNIGIFIGAVMYLLMAGRFVFEFKEGIADFKVKDIWLFALGGFIMGFGTRLGNGCNAGALFAPISNMSLSGWIYLVFLFMGGFIGNRFFVKCKVK